MDYHTGIPLPQFAASRTATQGYTHSCCRRRLAPWITAAQRLCHCCDLDEAARTAALGSVTLLVHAVEGCAAGCQSSPSACLQNPTRAQRREYTLPLSHHSASVTPLLSTRLPVALCVVVLVCRPRGQSPERRQPLLLLSPSSLHIVAVPLITLSLLATGFILVYLKEILVPLVVAVLFVYLLRPLVGVLTRPFADCCHTACLDGGATARYAAPRTHPRPCTLSDERSIRVGVERAPWRFGGAVRPWLRVVVSANFS